ncbi:hypothetical protein [Roseovarius aestuariivivens]|uniref:hypothetical protein n=1 Tax=Roseovarius aestuariivivens TaxID=1888910 RepID=UPI001081216B|nr:hypothetical protein [Roseovarius aestuariivivens]
MLIRFVRPNTVENMTAREGLFCAELPIPDAFRRSRAKGADRKDGVGLSWFKPEAETAIAKSFELIALLEEAGYPIEMLRTRKPGFVVYEDAWQIVAEPFSDTPK